MHGYVDSLDMMSGFIPGGVGRPLSSVERPVTDSIKQNGVAYQPFIGFVADEVNSLSFSITGLPEGVTKLKVELRDVSSERHTNDGLSIKMGDKIMPDNKWIDRASLEKPLEITVADTWRKVQVIVWYIKGDNSYQEEIKVNPKYQENFQVSWPAVKKQDYQIDADGGLLLELNQALPLIFGEPVVSIGERRMHRNAELTSDRRHIRVSDIARDGKIQLATNMIKVEMTSEAHKSEAAFQHYLAWSFGVNETVSSQLFSKLKELGVVEEFGGEFKVNTEILQKTEVLSQIKAIQNIPDFSGGIQNLLVFNSLNSTENRTSRESASKLLVPLIFSHTGRNISVTDGRAEISYGVRHGDGKVRVFAGDKELTTSPIEHSLGNEYGKRITISGFDPAIKRLRVVWSGDNQQTYEFFLDIQSNHQSLAATGQITSEALENYYLEEEGNSFNHFASDNLHLADVNQTMVKFLEANKERLLAIANNYKASLSLGQTLHLNDEERLFLFDLFTIGGSANINREIISIINRDNLENSDVLRLLTCGIYNHSAFLNFFVSDEMDFDDLIKGLQDTSINPTSAIDAARKILPLLRLIITEDTNNKMNIIKIQQSFKDYDMGNALHIFLWLIAHIKNTSNINSYRLGLDRSFQGFSKYIEENKIDADKVNAEVYFAYLRNNIQKLDDPQFIFDLFEYMTSDKNNFKQEFIKDVLDTLEREKFSNPPWTSIESYRTSVGVVDSFYQRLGNNEGGGLGTEWQRTFSGLLDAFDKLDEKVALDKQKYNNYLAMFIDNKGSLRSNDFIYGLLKDLHDNKDLLKDNNFVLAVMVAFSALGANVRECLLNTLGLKVISAEQLEKSIRIHKRIMGINQGDGIVTENNFIVQEKSGEFRINEQQAKAIIQNLVTKGILESQANNVYKIKYNAIIDSNLDLGLNDDLKRFRDDIINILQKSQGLYYYPSLGDNQSEGAKKLIEQLLSRVQIFVPINTEHYEHIFGHREYFENTLNPMKSNTLTIKALSLVDENDRGKLLSRMIEDREASLEEIPLNVDWKQNIEEKIYNDFNGSKRFVGDIFVNTTLYAQIIEKADELGVSYHNLFVYFLDKKGIDLTKVQEFLAKKEPYEKNEEVFSLLIALLDEDHSDFIQAITKDEIKTKILASPNVKLNDISINPSELYENPLALCDYYYRSLIIHQEETQWVLKNQITSDQLRGLIAKLNETNQNPKLTSLGNEVLRFLNMAPKDLVFTEENLAENYSGIVNEDTFMYVASSIFPNDKKKATEKATEIIELLRTSGILSRGISGTINGNHRINSDIDLSDQNLQLGLTPELDKHRTAIIDALQRSKQSDVASWLKELVPTLKSIKFVENKISVQGLNVAERKLASIIDMFNGITGTNRSIKRPYNYNPSALEKVKFLYLVDKGDSRVQQTIENYRDLRNSIGSGQYQPLNYLDGYGELTNPAFLKWFYDVFCQSLPDGVKGTAVEIFSSTVFNITKQYVTQTGSQEGMERSLELPAELDRRMKISLDKLQNNEALTLDEQALLQQAMLMILSELDLSNLSLRLGKDLDFNEATKSYTLNRSQGTVLKDALKKLIEVGEPISRLFRSSEDLTSMIDGVLDTAIERLDDTKYKDMMNIFNIFSAEKKITREKIDLMIIIMKELIEKKDISRLDIDKSVIESMLSRWDNLRNMMPSNGEGIEINISNVSSNALSGYVFQMSQLLGLIVDQIKIERVVIVKGNDNVQTGYIDEGFRDTWAGTAGKVALDGAGTVGSFLGRAASEWWAPSALTESFREGRNSPAVRRGGFTSDGLGTRLANGVLQGAVGVDLNFLLINLQISKMYPLTLFVDAFRTDISVRKEFNDGLHKFDGLLDSLVTVNERTFVDESLGISLEDSTKIYKALQDSGVLLQQMNCSSSVGRVKDKIASWFSDDDLKSSLQLLNLSDNKIQHVRKKLEEIEPFSAYSSGKLEGALDGGKNIFSALLQMQIGFYLYKNNVWFMLGALGFFEHLQNGDYLSAALTFMVANRYCATGYNARGDKSFWDSRYGRTLEGPLRDTVYRLLLLRAQKKGKGIDFWTDVYEKGFVGRAWDKTVAKWFDDIVNRMDERKANVQSLRAERSEKEAQRALLLRHGKAKDSPEIIKIDEKIRKYDQKISEAKKHVKGGEEILFYGQKVFSTLSNPFTKLEEHIVESNRNRHQKDTLGTWGDFNNFRNFDAPIRAIHTPIDWKNRFFRGANRALDELVPNFKAGLIRAGSWARSRVDSSFSAVQRYKSEAASTDIYSEYLGKNTDVFRLDEQGNIRVFRSEGRDIKQKSQAAQVLLQQAVEPNGQAEGFYKQGNQYVFNISALDPFTRTTIAGNTYVETITLGDIVIDRSGGIAEKGKVKIALYREDNKNPYDRVVIYVHPELLGNNDALKKAFAEAINELKQAAGATPTGTEASNMRIVSLDQKAGESQYIPVGTGTEQLQNARKQIVELLRDFGWEGNEIDRYFKITDNFLKFVAEGCFTYEELGSFLRQAVINNKPARNGSKTFEHIAGAIKPFELTLKSAMEFKEARMQRGVDSDNYRAAAELVHELVRNVQQMVFDEDKVYSELSKKTTTAIREEAQRLISEKFAGDSRQQDVAWRMVDSMLPEYLAAKTGVYKAYSDLYVALGGDIRRLHNEEGKIQVERIDTALYNLMKAEGKDSTEAKYNLHKNQLNIAVLKMLQDISAKLVTKEDQDGFKSWGTNKEEVDGWIRDLEGSGSSDRQDIADKIFEALHKSPLDLEEIKSLDSFKAYRQMLLKTFTLGWMRASDHEEKPFINQAIFNWLALTDKELALNLGAGEGKTKTLGGTEIARSSLGYTVVLLTSNPKDAKAALTDSISKRALGYFFGKNQIGSFKRETSDAVVQKTLAGKRLIITDNSANKFLNLGDVVGLKNILPIDSDKTLFVIVDEYDNNFYIDGSTPAIQSRGSGEMLSRRERLPYRIAVETMQKLLGEEYISVSKNIDIKKIFTDNPNLAKKVSYDSESGSLIIKGGLTEVEKNVLKTVSPSSRQQTKIDAIGPDRSSEISKFIDMDKGTFRGVNGVAKYRAMVRESLTAEGFSADERMVLEEKIMSMSGRLLHVVFNEKYGGPYKIVDGEIVLVDIGQRRVNWGSQNENKVLLEALHKYGIREEIAKVKGLSRPSPSSIPLTQRSLMANYLYGYAGASGTAIDFNAPLADEGTRVLAVESNVQQTLDIKPEIICNNAQHQHKQTIMTAMRSLVSGAPVLIHVPFSEAGNVDKDQMTIEGIKKELGGFLDFMLKLSQGQTDDVIKAAMNNEAKFNEYKGMYTELGGARFLFQYKRVVDYNNRVYNDIYKNKYSGYSREENQNRADRIFIDTIMHGEDPNSETQKIGWLGSGFIRILLSTNTNRAVDVQPLAGAIKALAEQYKVLRSEFGFENKGLVGIQTQFKEDFAFWIQEAYRLGRTEGISRAQGVVFNVLSIADASLRAHPTIRSYFRNIAAKALEKTGFIVTTKGDLPDNAYLRLGIGQVNKRAFAETGKVDLARSEQIRTMLQGKGILDADFRLLLRADNESGFISELDKELKTLTLTNEESAIIRAELIATRQKNVNTWLTDEDRTSLKAIETHFYGRQVVGKSHDELSKILGANGLDSIAIKLTLDMLKTSSIGEDLYKQIAQYLTDKKIDITTISTIGDFKQMLVAMGLGADSDGYKEVLKRLGLGVDFAKLTPVQQSTLSAKIKGLADMETGRLVEYAKRLFPDKASEFLSRLFNLRMAIDLKEQGWKTEDEVKGIYDGSGSIDEGVMSTVRTIKARLQQEYRDGIESTKAQQEQSAKASNVIQRFNDLLRKYELTWKNTETRTVVGDQERPYFVDLPVARIEEVKSLPQMMTILFRETFDSLVKEYENTRLQASKNNDEKIPFRQLFTDPIKYQTQINDFIKVIVEKTGVPIDLDFGKDKTAASNIQSFEVFRYGLLQKVFANMCENKAPRYRAIFLKMQKELIKLQNSFSQSEDSIKRNSGRILALTGGEITTDDHIRQSLPSMILQELGRRTFTAHSKTRLFSSKALAFTLFFSKKGYDIRKMNIGGEQSTQREPETFGGIGRSLFRKPVAYNMLACPLNGDESLKAGIILQDQVNKLQQNTDKYSLTYALNGKIIKYTYDSVQGKFLDENKSDLNEVLRTDTTKDVEARTTTEEGATNSKQPTQKQTLQLINLGTAEKPVFYLAEVTVRDCDEVKGPDGKTPHRIIIIHRELASSSNERIDFYGAVYNTPGTRFGTRSAYEVMITNEQIDEHIGKMIDLATKGDTSPQGRYALNMFDLLGINKESISGIKNNPTQRDKVLAFMAEFILVHESSHIAHLMDDAFQNISPAIRNMGEFREVFEVWADFSKTGLLGKIASGLQSKDKQTQKDALAKLNLFFIFAGKQRGSTEKQIADMIINKMSTTLGLSEISLADILAGKGNITPAQKQALGVALSEHSEAITRQIEEIKKFASNGANPRDVQERIAQFKTTLGMEAFYRNTSNPNPKDFAEMRSSLPGRAGRVRVETDGTGTKTLIINADRYIDARTEVLAMIESENGDQIVYIESKSEMTLKISSDQITSLAAANSALEPLLVRIENAFLQDVDFLKDIPVVERRKMAMRLLIVAQNPDPQARAEAFREFLPPKLIAELGQNYRITEADIHTLHGAFLALREVYQEIIKNSAELNRDGLSIEKLPFLEQARLVDQAIRQRNPNSQNDIERVPLFSLREKAKDALAILDANSSALFGRRRRVLGNSRLMEEIATQERSEQTSRYTNGELDENLDDSKKPRFAPEGGLKPYHVLGFADRPELITMGEGGLSPRVIDIKDANGVSIRTVHVDPVAINNARNIFQRKIDGERVLDRETVLRLQAEALKEAGFGERDADFMRSAGDKIGGHYAYPETIGALNELRKFRGDMLPADMIRREKEVIEFINRHQSDLRSDTSGVARGIFALNLGRLYLCGRDLLTGTDHARNAQIADAVKPEWFDANGQVKDEFRDKAMSFMLGQSMASKIGTDVRENLFQAIFVFGVIIAYRHSKGEDVLDEKTFRYMFDEMVVTSTLIKRSAISTLFNYKHMNTMTPLIATVGYSQIMAAWGAERQAVYSLAEYRVKESIAQVRHNRYVSEIRRYKTDQIETVSEDDGTDSFQVKGTNNRYKFQDICRDINKYLIDMEAKGLIGDASKEGSLSGDYKYTFLTQNKLTELLGSTDPKVKKLIEFLLSKRYLLDVSEEKEANKRYVVTKALLEAVNNDSFLFSEELQTEFSNQEYYEVRVLLMKSLNAFSQMQNYFSVMWVDEVISNEDVTRVFAGRTGVKLSSVEDKQVHEYLQQNIASLVVGSLYKKLLPSIRGKIDAQTHLYLLHVDEEKFVAVREELEKKGIKLSDKEMEIINQQRSDYLKIRTEMIAKIGEYNYRISKIDELVMFIVNSLGIKIPETNPNKKAEDALTYFKEKALSTILQEKMFPERRVIRYKDPTKEEVNKYFEYLLARTPDGLLDDEGGTLRDRIGQLKDRYLELMNKTNFEEEMLIFLTHYQTTLSAMGIRADIRALGYDIKRYAEGSELSKDNGVVDHLVFFEQEIEDFSLENRSALLGEARRIHGQDLRVGYGATASITTIGSFMLAKNLSTRGIKWLGGNHRFFSHYTAMGLGSTAAIFLNIGLEYAYTNDLYGVRAFTENVVAPALDSLSIYGAVMPSTLIQMGVRNVFGTDTGNWVKIEAENWGKDSDGWRSVAWTAARWTAPVAHDTVAVVALEVGSAKALRWGLRKLGAYNENSNTVYSNMLTPGEQAVSMLRAQEPLSQIGRRAAVKQAESSGVSFNKAGNVLRRRYEANGQSLTARQLSLVADTAKYKPAELEVLVKELTESIPEFKKVSINQNGQGIRVDDVDIPPSRAKEILLNHKQLKGVDHINRLLGGNVPFKIVKVNGQIVGLQFKGHGNQSFLCNQAEFTDAMRRKSGPLYDTFFNKSTKENAKRSGTNLAVFMGMMALLAAVQFAAENDGDIDWEDLAKHVGTSTLKSGSTMAAFALAEKALSKINFLRARATPIPFGGGARFAFPVATVGAAVLVELGLSIRENWGDLSTDRDAESSYIVHRAWGDVGYAGAKAGVATAASLLAIGAIGGAPGIVVVVVGGLVYIGVSEGIDLITEVSGIRESGDEKSISSALAEQSQTFILFEDNLGLNRRASSENRAIKRNYLSNGGERAWRKHMRDNGIYPLFSKKKVASIMVTSMYDLSLNVTGQIKKILDGLDESKYTSVNLWLEFSSLENGVASYRLRIISEQGIEIASPVIQETLKQQDELNEPYGDYLSDGMITIQGERVYSMPAYSYDFYANMFEKVGSLDFNQSQISVVNSSDYLRNSGHENIRSRAWSVFAPNDYSIGLLVRAYKYGMLKEDDMKAFILIPEDREFFFRKNFKIDLDSNQRRVDLSFYDVLIQALERSDYATLKALFSDKSFIYDREVGTREKNRLERNMNRLLENLLKGSMNRILEMTPRELDPLAGYSTEVLRKEFVEYARLGGRHFTSIEDLKRTDSDGIADVYEQYVKKYYPDDFEQRMTGQGFKETFLEFMEFPKTENPPSIRLDQLFHVSRYPEYQTSGRFDISKFYEGFLSEEQRRAFYGFAREVSDVDANSHFTKLGMYNTLESHLGFELGFDDQSYYSKDDRYYNFVTYSTPRLSVNLDSILVLKDGTSKTFGDLLMGFVFDNILVDNSEFVVNSAPFMNSFYNNIPPNSWNSKSQGFNIVSIREKMTPVMLQKFDEYISSKQINGVITRSQLDDFLTGYYLDELAVKNGLVVDFDRYIKHMSREEKFSFVGMLKAKGIQKSDNPEMSAITLDFVLKMMNEWESYEEEFSNSTTSSDFLSAYRLTIEMLNIYKRYADNSFNGEMFSNHLNLLEKRVSHLETKLLEKLRKYIRVFEVRELSEIGLIIDGGRLLGIMPEGYLKEIGAGNPELEDAIKIIYNRINNLLNSGEKIEGADRRIVFDLIRNLDEQKHTLFSRSSSVLDLRLNTSRDLTDSIDSSMKAIIMMTDKEIIREADRCVRMLDIVISDQYSEIELINMWKYFSLLMNRLYIVDKMKYDKYLQVLHNKHKLLLGLVSKKEVKVEISKAYVRVQMQEIRDNIRYAFECGFIGTVLANNPKLKDDLKRMQRGGLTVDDLTNYVFTNGGGIDPDKYRSLFGLKREINGYVFDLMSNENVLRLTQLDELHSSFLSSNSVSLSPRIGASMFLSEYSDKYSYGEASGVLTVTGVITEKELKELEKIFVTTEDKKALAALRIKSFMDWFSGRIVKDKKLFDDEQGSGLIASLKRHYVLSCYDPLSVSLIANVITNSKQEKEKTMNLLVINLEAKTLLIKFLNTLKDSEDILTDEQKQYLESREINVENLQEHVGDLVSKGIIDKIGEMLYYL